MFELIAVALVLGVAGNITAIATRNVVGDYMVLASAAIALCVSLAL